MITDMTGLSVIRQDLQAIAERVPCINDAKDVARLVIRLIDLLDQQLDEIILHIPVD